MERLQILNKSNDGFFIASEDLKLRGPGDMFGVRQSGDFAFKVGDIYTDSTVLKEASDAADYLFQTDRMLEKPEKEGIRKQLEQMAYLQEELGRTL